MDDPSGFSSVSSTPREVASFYIDQFSASGGQFLAAVNAGGVTTPRGRAAITTTQLSCPFVDVGEGLSESRHPMWSSVSPIGRSEAIKVYMGSTNRVTQVVFRFRWTEGETEADLRKQVQAPADLLLALTTSFRTTQGRWMPPPPVMLTLPGVSMRAIVESCDIRWLSPWWTNTAGVILPTGSDVQVAFAEVREGSN